MVEGRTESEPNRTRRPAEVAHELYEPAPAPGGTYRRRVTVLAWVLTALMAGLWLRLAHLQLVRGAECRRLCDSLIRKMVPLPAHRGTIRARDGRPLAIDEPAFDIALAYPAMVLEEGWIRRQERLHGITREEVLRRLRATWTGLARLSASSEDELRQVAGRIIARVQAIKERVSTAHGRPVTVREERLAHPLIRDVDLAMVEQVLERSDEWLGVEVQVRTRRRYPEGPTAAHVVGYMLRIRDKRLREYGVAYRGDPRRAYQVGETIGAAGVEAAKNFELRGRRGWAHWLVNARGEVQRTLERVEPVPGSDITLSIDLALQRRAEEALARACAARATTGAAVLLDVHTGEVLAMASYPAFDPAEVRNEYARLAADSKNPLLDRAIASHYPPGSVFKVVDSIAALERGSITPATRFACHHRFLVGRRYFRCEGSHGLIDFTTALAKSCNIYFYKTGLATGMGPIARLASQLGLGSPTGISFLSEAPGFVPSGEQLKALWPGDVATMAIGQGRILVTPIQMAVAFSALVNGGEVLTPRIVEAIRSPDGRTLKRFARQVRRHVVIPREHLDLVLDALRGVVNEGGTGWRARVKGILVAGKTGTAQVVQRVGEEEVPLDQIPYNRRPHSWFVGFAPAERPRIVFVVVVEHGGPGGGAAASYAREVVDCAAKAGLLGPPPGARRAAPGRLAARMSRPVSRPLKTNKDCPGLLEGELAAR